MYVRVCFTQGRWRRRMGLSCHVTLVRARTPHPSRPPSCTPHVPTVSSPRAPCRRDSLLPLFFPQLSITFGGGAVYRMDAENIMFEVRGKRASVLAMDGGRVVMRERSCR